MRRRCGVYVARGRRKASLMPWNESGGSRRNGGSPHQRPDLEVLLPKVTRQNIIEIGMRTGLTARGASGAVTNVREESLMLSGDENIVDVNFVVFWRIQDATKYLFNIQNPETTVKEVAESAMREVVGQSNIQPLLTGARQKTEQAVQKLMQDVLDFYGAGIR